MQVHAPTSVVDEMAKDSYTHWCGGKRLKKMEMRFKAAQAAAGTFTIKSPLRPTPALTCTETLAPEPEPSEPVMSEFRRDLEDKPLAMDATLYPIQLFTGSGAQIADYIHAVYFTEEDPPRPATRVVVLQDNCDLNDVLQHASWCCRTTAT
jgi:hypothetical protein